MSILKFFAGLVGIVVAALVGNYVGDQLRGRATGEKGHQYQITHTPKGEAITVNPNLTNVGPALALGMMLRPHAVWAFLGGVLASGLLGERYEQHAKDYIKSKMPGRGQTGTEEMQ